jgi:hypothetical protein
MFLAPLSVKDGDVFDLSFIFAPTYYSKETIVSSESKCNILRISDKIPGLFIIENLMTNEECDKICKLSENIGYSKTKGIGTDSLQPPDKIFYCISPIEADILFRRCSHLLSLNLCENLEAIGINPWFRLYKYNKNSSLNPHYDRGNYYGSAVDSDGHDGQLRYDYYKDGRISRMSCLIYLNDNMTGGDTIFYVNDEILSITPKKGTAVFFYHGDHNLSPLNEGSVVTEGTKYIIRTDLLCRDLF